MKPEHVNPHHAKKLRKLDDNNSKKKERRAPKEIVVSVDGGYFSHSYI